MTQEVTPEQIEELQARIARYLPGCDPGIAVSHAAGSWVYALDKSRYLDFGEGGAVMLLGHGYYSVRSAVRDHLDSYWYPGSPVELATLYPGCYAELLSSRFAPVDGRARQVLVCGSVAEARQVVAQLSAGRFLEVRTVSPDHSLDGGMVQDLVHQARLADKVVVADETQSGFGRTGAFLGVDHYNFRPDVVMLGPSGAAGLPFAAVVAPAQLFERSGPWRLSQVSPLVCAAAYGVLVGLTEPVLDNVTEMARRLDGVIAELSDQFSEIAGITGVGLLRQVHLTRPAEVDRFRRDCRTRGLLTGPDLVLTPPLTVTGEEIDAVADIMAEVLMEWRAV